MWVRIPPRASQSLGLRMAIRTDRVAAVSTRGTREIADIPRRAADRAAPEGARREQAVHAVGRASVLDLRRLSRGGHRDRGRAPRVDGGVRGGGLGEGHARAGRVRADGRTGGDERDERDGLGAGEPLADGRARRPRAGDALGAGLAAGDRPRAVRAAADASWRRRRGARRRSRGCVDDAFAAACAPHGGPAFVDFPLDYVFMEAPELDGESAAGTLRARRAGRADGGDRAGGRAAGGGGAPGDHGGHGPVLGARRAGAARARGDAAHPGVPERAGARMRGGGPRAVLLARALAGAEGRGRGARASACRWTSASASGRRSARTRRSW